MTGDRFHLPILRLAVLALCVVPSVLPGQVLIREVVSREHSIHVGGVDTAIPREAFSREISLSVENGRESFAQVISREYDLLVSSPEPPPAITGVVMTVSPTGEMVTLDWSSYNQWAIGDILRFEIYLSDDGPFSNVTGMTPVDTAAGGTTSLTLTGLAAYRDHYIAIVAVDGLGNFIPAVTYSAAYVLSPQVVSREVSLFIGQEPDSPYRSVVSREYDLAVASPEPPPAITGLVVTASPSGDAATLDWSAYNQWLVGDIQRFDIYLSDDGAFTNVGGRTPFQSISAGATSISLTGLTPGRDHFFAVVPVDALEHFDPVVAYSAAYVLSPQVVSREVSLFVGQEPPPPPPVLDAPLALPNPGFEFPDIANFVYWGAMSAAQKSAFAWIGSGNGTNGPSVFNNGGAWGFQNVPEGTQGLALQADSAATIEVDFPAPGTYWITWQAAARGTQNNPYVLKLDGVTVSPVFSTSDPAWKPFSHAIAVTSAGTQVLAFAALNSSGGDNTVGIDDVSVRLFLAPGERIVPDQRELVSREYSIVVPDDAVPAPVTGVGSTFAVATATQAFGAVNLVWPGYDEASQFDVVRYRVYVGNSYFESVAGLTPYSYLPPGSQAGTVTGLTGNGIFYFAVIAEDALGNFNPAVRAISGQASISGVGEVRNLAGTSFSTSLQFTWTAPEDAGEFLRGYRVYFGAATSPVELPPDATSFEATDLLPGTGYAFRIATLDPFGGESGGVSLLGGTILPIRPTSA